ncbi:MAG: ABC transporter ATP-binding protein [Anaerolineae bacterium]|nr:ABC transporter ATP-binding protein [Anaerolineae bacterium]
MELALQVTGITKHFPGVLANDHIDFDLKKAEIHALLGENGAGKSTLMNVIYGLYHPDEGEIRVDGELIVMHNPNDAIKHGIGMVHQHFMLIPVFTVAENIMLGAERLQLGDGVFDQIKTAWRSVGNWWRAAKASLGVLNRRGVAQRVRELSHQYGLDVDPDALVSDLPVGMQQRVEIVKALYRQAAILILDEPTAVLTPQEADELFRIMRELTAQGISIVFISHKLKEVLKISDRITVLRDGRVVGTTTSQETDQAHLAAMMVGREVILQVEKSVACPGEKVLDVRNVDIFDDRGVQTASEITFDLCQGEVLGVAGVQGNGQTELVEALTGLRHVHGGTIAIQGQDVTNRPPRAITEVGTAHIPEDRQKFGLVLSYPITDNMVLCTYYLSPFARHGVLNHQAIDENGRKLVEKFDVRTPSPYVAASKLSGGNQQKVIVARELSRPIKLIVANQPTRGLDVGSIEYIHKEIIRMRDAGCAVLLVSAELDEIMALSDRIAVMCGGRIVSIVPAARADRETLGLMMAGVECELPELVQSES